MNNHSLFNNQTNLSKNKRFSIGKQIVSSSSQNSQGGASIIPKVINTNGVRTVIPASRNNNTYSSSNTLTGNIYNSFNNVNVNLSNQMQYSSTRDDNKVRKLALEDEGKENNTNNLGHVNINSKFFSQRTDDVVAGIRTPVNKAKKINLNSYNSSSIQQNSSTNNSSKQNTVNNSFRLGRNNANKGQGRNYPLNNTMNNSNTMKTSSAYVNSIKEKRNSNTQSNQREVFLDSNSNTEGYSHSALAGFSGLDQRQNSGGGGNKRDNSNQIIGYSSKKEPTKVVNGHSEGFRPSGAPMEVYKNPYKGENLKEKQHREISKGNHMSGKEKEENNYRSNDYNESESPIAESSGNNAHGKAKSHSQHSNLFYYSSNINSNQSGLIERTESLINEQINKLSDEEEEKKELNQNDKYTDLPLATKQEKVVVKIDPKDNKQVQLSKAESSSKFSESNSKNTNTVVKPELNRLKEIIEGSDPGRTDSNANTAKSTHINNSNLFQIASPSNTTSKTPKTYNILNNNPLIGGNNLPSATLSLHKDKESQPLSLNNLSYNFQNYDNTKCSIKSIGNLKAYAANTYQGIVRNYNEDRVSIILNISKPVEFTGNWPKCSI